MFSKDILPLNLHCFSCGSSVHLIDTCPLIHYAPDIMLTLKRYLCSENQERNEKNRKKFRYSSLNHLKDIQYKALFFDKSPHNNESKTNKDSELSGEDESATLLADCEEKTNKNYGEKTKENKSKISLNSIQSEEEIEKNEFLEVLI